MYANGRNIVGQHHTTLLGLTCCVRLHGTTTVLAALVAYSLKPVKLLGPCKRTQHCLAKNPQQHATMLWLQCCVRLHGPLNTRHTKCILPMFNILNELFWQNLSFKALSLFTADHLILLLSKKLVPRSYQTLNVVILKLFDLNILFLKWAFQRLKGPWKRTQHVTALLHVVGGFWTTMLRPFA